jgi:uncharacterized lipoprotein YbaY
MKKMIIACIAATALAMLSGCATHEDPPASAPNSTTSSQQTVPQNYFGEQGAGIR